MLTYLIFLHLYLFYLVSVLFLIFYSGLSTGIVLIAVIFQLFLGLVFNIFCLVSYLFDFFANFFFASDL